MQVLTRFTYPTFIGLCGLLGTFSDILQNSNIAIGAITGLLMLGLACLLLPRELVVDRFWSGLLGNDVSEQFSARPFGLSCALLAMLLYGFSTLSTKAGEEGGVIAAQFPEVHQLQVALGVAQQDIATIKTISTEIRGDTSRLLESSERWLKFELFLLHEANGHKPNGEWNHVPSGASVFLFNETPLQYEDLLIVLSVPGQGEIYRKSYPRVLDREQRQERNAINVPYESVDVCISAKRRGQEEWLTDKHSLAIHHGPDQYTTEYQKSDSSGVQIFTSETKCG